MAIYTHIVGTGSVIPEVVVRNEEFLDHQFIDPKTGKPYEKEGQVVTTAEIVANFYGVSGIRERRYARPDQDTTDLAYLAAKDALDSSVTDPESLDAIIDANNFGNISVKNKRSEMVPSIAARVKHKLRIENPKTICYDLVFGCPGWLQGVIQANYFIKSGDFKRIMVIGSENLPAVCDPNDRDIHLYSAGAGAVILEGRLSDKPTGILSYAARSDTYKDAFRLRMEQSYGKDKGAGEFYLHMDGHDLFEYALRTVPGVVEECLLKADLKILDISKILIHQANDKLDEAIVKKLLGLKGKGIHPPEGLMPMTISWLGNPSVASIPTLLDLILKGKMPGHSLNPEDHVVFASVGAGMNVNAVSYLF